MAEEETDGISAGMKHSGNDFYKNETKESVPHVSEVSPSSSSSSSSSSPSVSQKTNTNTVNKGKSCKGCLYYSSAIKSNSGNPLCVGISRSLPSVPRYIVGESEMEATKKGRSLNDFKYGCIGYSVYPDWKDRSPHIQENKTELPVCVGFEILADRRLVPADSASTLPRNKEDGNPAPASAPPRKPAHSFGGEFLNRFTRNAGLVAMGVAKNLKRVGNQIKESVDDILYPYRRPPK